MPGCGVSGPICRDNLQALQGLNAHLPSFLEYLENARRRRERYGLPEEATSALRSGGDQERAGPQGRPLTAAAGEGTGDEEEAVDVRQLKLPPNPAAEDGGRRTEGG